MTRSTRAAAIAGSILAATAAYRFAVSSRIPDWGATGEETLRAMPGDDLVPKPAFHANHAVTINAPPEDIWPWLLQLGYGRAGFYSYAWLEQIMGLQAIQNANRVLPEFQQLKLGDRVPIGPGTGGGGEVALSVVALQPERHLCLAMHDEHGRVTWAFGLYAVDARRTRLVSRNRALMLDWTLPRILANPARWRTELPMKLFINVGGLLMVRKMLLGIKNRAERMHQEEVKEEQVMALSSGCE